MDKYEDKLIDRMVGWINAWIDIETDKYIGEYGFMDGYVWMDKCINKWINECIGKWRD